MPTVISIHDVSKVYQLGTIGGGTLQGDFSRWWAKMRGKPDPTAMIGDDWNESRDHFRALDHVSFEVEEGEIVGLIGRNGAGKSTLLKILSQITLQTSGEIKIKGRIASLLEVGTGFHPDLTGRENIFLNGAILGMTKREIRQKFDEIVAFSEIGPFLETPVKRYSSGMYVRLAFAVAAHLDPEILIIDEVLAVGDAEFQKKCLGKIKEVGRSGRTVLFVSHNVNAVATLCSRAVVLSRGRLIFKGGVREALGHYGASTDVAGAIDFSSKNGASLMRSMQIRGDGGPSDGVVRPLQPVTLNFDIDTPNLLKKPRLSVGFTNGRSERVFAVASNLGPGKLPPLHGSNTIRIAFIMPTIVPGKYALDIGFYDDETSLAEEYYSAGTIEVAETNYLEMLDQNVECFGQLHVRSTCTAVAA